MRLLRLEPLAEEGVEFEPFVAKVEGGVTVRCLPEEGGRLVGLKVAAAERGGFGQWRDEGRTAVQV